MFLKAQLEMQRKNTFPIKKRVAGISDSEIQALENQLAVLLPTIFKAYLRIMGKHHGILFFGSKSNPDDFLKYRIWAEEIMHAEQIPSILTSKSVVFTINPGFAFRYFDGTSHDEDAPVWSHIKYLSSVRVAKTFRDSVESDISEVEASYNYERDRGGFYRIVTDEGACKSEFPNPSDQRPLSIGDCFIE